MKQIRMSRDDFYVKALIQIARENGGPEFAKAFKETEFKVYVAETEEEAAMMAEEDWKP
mgnify:CR=1 FL=1